MLHCVRCKKFKSCEVDVDLTGKAHLSGAVDPKTLLAVPLWFVNIFVTWIQGSLPALALGAAGIGH